MSERFYVSDSFSLNPVVNAGWHFPGAFNSAAAWSVSKPVTAEWYGGELGYVVYVDGGGLNADVFLCLYDVGAAVPGSPAPPVLVGGQPVILKFLASDDSPLGDAILINGVCRLNQYARAARYLTKPLRVGGVTTPATGGPFQLGALFRFFGPGGVTLNYQYMMDGVAIDADLLPAAPPPPPPPPPAGSTMFTLTAPSGTYTWPVEPV